METRLTLVHQAIKVSTFCRAMQIQSGVTSPRGGHRMNFKRPTVMSLYNQVNYDSGTEHVRSEHYRLNQIRLSLCFRPVKSMK